MLTLASASGVPAWFAAVVIGIGALGTAITAIGSAINAVFQLRRLKELDEQRTRREVAQHAELMSAVQARTTWPSS